MNHQDPVGRAGPPRWVRLALVMAAMFVMAPTLPAQVRDTLPSDPVPPAVVPDTIPGGPAVEDTIPPVRAVPDTIPPGAAGPDTVRLDTLIVPVPPEGVVPDTLPADTLMPRVPEPLVLPAFPLYRRPLPLGWATGRWEWDREELQRYQGYSVYDLLERVPGLQVVRAGAFGSPAGVTALGLGGGRVRVFRDGFEVDPFTAAALDLQQIGLIDLEAVRVERTTSGIRIDLRGFDLGDPSPYSAVEIGTGNFRARMLRALFARPLGSRSMAVASFDLGTVQGFGGVREPTRASAGSLRWSYALSRTSGLQFEYRHNGIEREGERFPEDSDRREVVLRGRSRILPNLTLDAMLGRATRRAGGPEPFETDLHSNQAAVRAAYERHWIWTEAAGRVRSAETLGPGVPETDLSGRVVLRPLDLVVFEGEARAVRRDGLGGVELSASARSTPVYGLSLFAAATAGERLVGLIRDTSVIRRDSTEQNGQPAVRVDTTVTPIFLSRLSSAEGFRAGVEWTGWGTTLGAASVTVAASPLVPFGTAFDRPVEAVETEAVSGIELFGSGSVPWLGRNLRVEGSFTRWTDVAGRPYLPLQSGRLSLIYHAVHLSGQFEPTLRLDAVHRGSAVAPALDLKGFTGVVEPYTMVNFFMQLRIIDVRAFMLYENVFNNRRAMDLLDTPFPGSRMLYGVRWHFRD